MVKTTTKSDAAIQEEVQGELRWDTRVEETDIGVEDQIRIEPWT